MCISALWLLRFMEKLRKYLSFKHMWHLSKAPNLKSINPATLEDPCLICGLHNISFCRTSEYDINGAMKQGGISALLLMKKHSTMKNCSAAIHSLRPKYWRAFHSKSSSRCTKLSLQFSFDDVSRKTSLRKMMTSSNKTVSSKVNVPCLDPKCSYSK